MASKKSVYKNFPNTEYKKPVFDQSDRYGHYNALSDYDKKCLVATNFWRIVNEIELIEVPVLGMVERNGKLSAKKVESVGSDVLTPEVIKLVKESATIYTDEWLGYKGVSRIYDHSVVKHNQGEYVNGRIHTNTIEGFWSLLKRGIFGIYHFTSKKHLQKYVDEFVFRYNTREVTTSSRFNKLLANNELKLTYKQLING